MVLPLVTEPHWSESRPPKQLGRGEISPAQFSIMKVLIVISKDAAGKLDAEYVGQDGEKARAAGQKAAAAGKDAWLYFKPFHAKRFSAEPKSAKK